MVVCVKCLLKRDDIYKKVGCGSNITVINKSLQIKDILPDSDNAQDLLKFLADNENIAGDYVSTKIGEMNGVKWNLTFNVRVSKIDKDGVDGFDDPFRSL